MISNREYFDRLAIAVSLIAGVTYLDNASGGSVFIIPAGVLLVVYVGDLVFSLLDGKSIFK